jgi:hypothetical protein
VKKATQMAMEENGVSGIPMRFFGGGGTVGRYRSNAMRVLL